MENGKCPYCGSTNLETGIIWGPPTTSAVGLWYKKGKITHDTEQVYSDLCLACGSIVRTYIKGNTYREWIRG